MADDDEYVDEELLALLRQSMLNGAAPATPARNAVLDDAEFVYDNAIDVAIDMAGTKAAAESIYARMQARGSPAQSWAEHPLHPKVKDASTDDCMFAVDFIFTMDLLNFSFWPDDPQGPPFTVEHDGEAWTGYSSLLAALWRARAEGHPITSPSFWCDEEECTDEILGSIFRSSTDTPMPLLEERIAFLREAGEVLCDRFDGSFSECIKEAANSALKLVEILVTDFPTCFRDEARFEDRTVHFHKRAQILVADLWACFEGKDAGHFDDIEKLTMFPDYRVPQLLNSMGCLQYSPPVESHIRAQQAIERGHSWEVQLRGCSVWAVELIRRHIVKQHPETTVNAILIDFFLYDTAKAREREGVEMAPHHRCRTVCY